jgi:hypothetical protein
MWGRSKSTLDVDAEIRRLGHRRFYHDNGFSIFRSVLPVSAIDALVNPIKTDLTEYDGPIARHYGDPAPHVLSADGRILNSIAQPHLVTVPALQAFREAAVAVFCHPAVADCLGKLDGQHSYGFQGALLFFVSPLTTIHDDSWSCNTLPPGGSFTVWIPLEEFDAFSGPPYVIRWPLGKLMTPAELGIEFPPEDTPGWAHIAQPHYDAALGAKVRRDGMAMIVPFLHRGDMLIFASTTPHGSLPAHPADRSRLSLQGIYRPMGVPWGAYLYESGKHRFGPAVREERRHNDQFTLTLPPGMSW